MKIFQALALGVATVAGTVSADDGVTDVSQKRKSIRVDRLRGLISS